MGLQKALSLAIWDAAIWTWQVQVLAFLVLSVISAVIGRVEPPEFLKSSVRTCAPFMPRPDSSVKMLTW